jgi:hypothetical protein
MTWENCLLSRQRHSQPIQNMTPFSLPRQGTCEILTVHLFHVEDYMWDEITFSLPGHSPFKYFPCLHWSPPNKSIPWLMSLLIQVMIKCETYSCPFHCLRSSPNVTHFSLPGNRHVCILVYCKSVNCLRSLPSVNLFFVLCSVSMPICESFSCPMARPNVNPF